LLRHRPESRWQTKLAHGSRQGKGGGAVADHFRQLLGGAQVSLVDNAGLALDAGAVDDVVVELVAFLFGDEAWHIG